MSFNYNKLPPFKWYVLENFPFIEATFDGITNWQLLEKLGNAINKDRNSINILGTQVQSLTDYVSNYFENLDVQEEINNKLDEMAESGELEEIIASYINANSMLIFENVEDLKDATNLIAGSYAKTLGYYAKGDLGGAEYYITDANINTDDKFVILLDSGLKAVLQYKDEINVQQIGGRAQKNSTKYDLHDYILAYIEKNEASDLPFKLYLPAGIYYTTPVEIVSTNYYIYGAGEQTGVINGVSLKPTILSAINNQEYVIKFGNNVKGSGYGTFENIVLSTCNYADDFSRTTYNYVTNAVMILNWVYYMRFRWLSFEYIIGRALKVTTSWELQFGTVDFNHIDSHDSSVVLFDEVLATVDGGNISDSNIEYMRFEQVIGTLIKMNEDCKLINMHIGTINVEPSIWQDNNYEWGEYDGALTYTVTPIFDINGMSSFVLDSLLLNNLNWRYQTLDEVNYIVGDIIHLTNTDLLYNITINTINLWHSRAQVNLVKSIGSVYDNWKSILVVNNVVNNTEYDLACNVKDVAKLQIKNPLAGALRDTMYVTEYGARIPCYKNVKNNDYTTKGLINYDSNSTNADKLVLKNPGTLSSIGKRMFGFVYNSDTFNIRAKIANEGTLKFNLYVYNPSTNTYTSTGGHTLTGTGAFKNYTVTLGTNYPDLYGTIGYFQLIDNNDTLEFELDNYSN